MTTLAGLVPLMTLTRSRGLAWLGAERALARAAAATYISGHRQGLQLASLSADPADVPATLHCAWPCVASAVSPTLSLPARCSVGQPRLEAVDCVILRPGLFRIRP